MDFKTKNYHCLFLDLLVLRIDLQNGLSCPLLSGLGFFSFFSSFGFEHHHISYFFGMFKPFGPFGFFHVFHLCLGIFYSLRIFFSISRTCPLIWGVILVRVIFQQRFTRLNGDCKWFFYLVKGLSKIAFSYFKRMHS